MVEGDNLAEKRSWKKSGTEPTGQLTGYLFRQLAVNVHHTRWRIVSISMHKVFLWKELWNGEWSQ